MDVHKYHANLPIELIDKDAKRMSIVSYLRINIFKKTDGMSKQTMERHVNSMKKHRTVKGNKKSGNSPDNKTRKKGINPKAVSLFNML